MKQEYVDIYNAVWQFLKKHIDNVNSSDEFWDTVNKEADELSKQFNNHPLFNANLIAVWDEFARVLAQQKEDTKEGNSEEENKPP